MNYCVGCKKLGFVNGFAYRYLSQIKRRKDISIGNIRLSAFSPHHLSTLEEIIYSLRLIETILLIFYPRIISVELIQ